MLTQDNICTLEEQAILIQTAANMLERALGKLDDLTNSAGDKHVHADGTMLNLNGISNSLARLAGDAESIALEAKEVQEAALLWDTDE